MGTVLLGATRAIQTLVGAASELNMVPVRERVAVPEPWASVNEAGEITADFIKGDKDAQIEKACYLGRRHQRPPRVEFCLKKRPFVIEGSFMVGVPGLNQGPIGYEPTALTTELYPPWL